MSCILIALWRKCDGFMLVAYVGVLRVNPPVFPGIRSIRVQRMNGIMPRYQVIA